MNTEQAILETVRTLPLDKQQEVLDFAEFLRQKTEAKNQLDKTSSNNLDKFKQLVTTWRTEQDPFSSIINFDHSAYQAIIEMGLEGIPLILKELQEDPDYWFYALQEITKENSVPSEQEGNLDKMTKAWLTWGKERGYINE
jgi:hypothetical protein